MLHAVCSLLTSTALVPVGPFEPCGPCGPCVRVSIPCACVFYAPVDHVLRCSRGGGMRALAWRGCALSMQILSKGGAGDPLGMLTTVIGTAPTPAAMLAEVQP
jgi:hypothetical protein